MPRGGRRKRDDTPPDPSTSGYPPNPHIERRREHREAGVAARERGVRAVRQGGVTGCGRCGATIRAYEILRPPDSDQFFCRPCYDLLIQSWVKIAERAMVLDKRYQSIYGLTLEDYGALFLRQGGACAICRRSKNLPAAGLLVVDHDHATGEVRGLLCSNCNTGIGLLGDSVKNLGAAVVYLAR